MGVKVERVDQVFEAPVLIRLEGRVSVLAGRSGESAGRRGSSSRHANRRHAGGQPPPRSRCGAVVDDLRHRGERLPLPPDRSSSPRRQKTRETIESLARDLGLRPTHEGQPAGIARARRRAPRGAVQAVDGEHRRRLDEAAAGAVRVQGPDRQRRRHPEGRPERSVRRPGPSRSRAGTRSSRPQARNRAPEYAGGLGNDGWLRSGRSSMPAARWRRSTPPASSPSRRSAFR